MVLDSSTSISGEDYTNFKTRLADGVLEAFDDTSRLGVMQFSTFNQIEFNLKNNCNKIFSTVVCCTF